MQRVVSVKNPLAIRSLLVSLPGEASSGQLSICAYWALVVGVAVGRLACGVVAFAGQRADEVARRIHAALAFAAHLVALAVCAPHGPAFRHGQMRLALL